MQPAYPCLLGTSEVEAVYGAAQKEFIPLQVFKSTKAVMSRWTFTEEERKHVAAGGDLYFCVLNFGGPLQPILPLACGPDEALDTLLRLEEDF